LVSELEGDTQALSVGQAVYKVRGGVMGQGKDSLLTKAMCNEASGM
jgi:hypothetical protein